MRSVTDKRKNGSIRMGKVTSETVPTSIRKSEEGRGKARRVAAAERPLWSETQIKQRKELAHCQCRIGGVVSATHFIDSYTKDFSCKAWDIRLFFSVKSDRLSKKKNRFYVLSSMKQRALDDLRWRKTKRLLWCVDYCVSSITRVSSIGP